MNIKKKKYKSKIILVIILIVIFFSLFYYFINDREKDNIITSTIKDITSYISKITSFSFIKDNNYNKDLINEINKDYLKEIDNLKKILNLNKTNSDKKFINATTIKRSPSFYDIITIDKGKKSGIKKGLAVINNNGLIGTIINVNNISSDIKLLTSLKDNYISVKFSYEDKDYFGIINNYDYINNEYTLINVIGDFNKEKIKDINVVTSGLIDNIESGLLIGKIKETSKDTFGISNIIKIEPTVNFNNINIVSVIGDNND